MTAIHAPREGPSRQFEEPLRPTDRRWRGRNGNLRSDLGPIYPINCVLKADGSHAVRREEDGGAIALYDSGRKAVVTTCSHKSRRVSAIVYADREFPRRSNARLLPSTKRKAEPTVAAAVTFDDERCREEEKRGEKRDMWQRVEDIVGALAEGEGTQQSALEEDEGTAKASRTRHLGAIDEWGIGIVESTPDPTGARGAYEVTSSHICVQQPTGQQKRIPRNNKELLQVASEAGQLELRLNQELSISYDVASGTSRIRFSCEGAQEIFHVGEVWRLPRGSELSPSSPTTSPAEIFEGLTMPSQADLDASVSQLDLQRTQHAGWIKTDRTVLVKAMSQKGSSTSHEAETPYQTREGGDPGAPSAQGRLASKVVAAQQRADVTKKELLAAMRAREDRIAELETELQQVKLDQVKPPGGNSQSRSSPSAPSRRQAATLLPLGSSSSAPSIGGATPSEKLKDKVKMTTRLLEDQISWNFEGSMKKQLRDKHGPLLRRQVSQPLFQGYTFPRRPVPRVQNEELNISEPRALKALAARDVERLGSETMSNGKLLVVLVVADWASRSSDSSCFHARKVSEAACGELQANSEESRLIFAVAELSEAGAVHSLTKWENPLVRLFGVREAPWMLIFDRGKCVLSENPVPEGLGGGLGFAKPMRNQPSLAKARVLVLEPMPPPPQPASAMMLADAGVGCRSVNSFRTQIEVSEALKRKGFGFDLAFSISEARRMVSTAEPPYGAFIGSSQVGAGGIVDVATRVRERQAQAVSFITHDRRLGGELEEQLQSLAEAGDLLRGVLQAPISKSNLDTAFGPIKALRLKYPRCGMTKQALVDFLQKRLSGT